VWRLYVDGVSLCEYVSGLDCYNLLGVKGVQVEEIWSFDPESFSQIK